MKPTEKKSFQEMSKEDIKKMQSQYAKEHGGIVDRDSDVARIQSTKEKLLRKPINTQSPYEANVISKQE
jgi:hypothetical protein